MIARSAWVGVTVAVAIFYVCLLLSAPRSDGGVVQDRVDFGDVFLSRKHVFELPIRNLGAEPIHIKSFSTSCSCTSVSPPNLTLAAGETVQLKLTVDLTKSQPPSSHEDAWPFRVNIHPLTDLGAPMIAPWSIQARVRQAVSLAPSRLLYEATSALELGRPVPSRIVDLSSTLPIRNFTLSEPTGTWKCQTLEQTARSARIRISADPFTEAVRKTWDLEFNGEIEGAGPLSIVIGRIDAAVTYPVRTVPNSINFGAVNVSLTQRQRIVLSSPRGVAFTVEAVQCSDPQYAIERVAEGPNRIDISYEVSVTPRQKGPGVGRVTFRVRIPETSESFDLDVGIAIHGVDTQQTVTGFGPHDESGPTRKEPR